jgi:hypothetical protein
MERYQESNVSLPLSKSLSCAAILILPVFNRLAVFANGGTVPASLSAECKGQPAAGILSLNSRK